MNECKECGCELTEREIEIDRGYCDSCDSECHCSQCQETKRPKLTIGGFNYDEIFGDIFGGA